MKRALRILSPFLLSIAVAASIPAFAKGKGGGWSSGSGQVVVCPGKPPRLLDFAVGAWGREIGPVFQGMTRDQAIMEALHRHFVSAPVDAQALYHVSQAYPLSAWEKVDSLPVVPWGYGHQTDDTEKLMKSFRMRNCKLATAALRTSHYDEKDRHLISMKIEYVPALFNAMDPLDQAGLLMHEWDGVIAREVRRWYGDMPLSGVFMDGTEMFFDDYMRSGMHDFLLDYAMDINSNGMNGAEFEFSVRRFEATPRRFDQAAGRRHRDFIHHYFPARTMVSVPVSNDGKITRQDIDFKILPQPSDAVAFTTFTIGELEIERKLLKNTELLLIFDKRIVPPSLLEEWKTLPAKACKLASELAPQYRGKTVPSLFFGVTGGAYDRGPNGELRRYRSGGNLQLPVGYPNEIPYPIQFQQVLDYCRDELKL